MNKISAFEMKTIDLNLHILEKKMGSKNNQSSV